MLNSITPSSYFREIDEIIVSYVVSVVEEVVASPDSFDAESFLEMITAYIPNASSISPEAATEWMMRLVHEEEEKQKKGTDDGFVTGANGARIFDFPSFQWSRKTST